MKGVMERPEFMIFRRKFADTSSNIAAKLRQHIERDVDGTSFRSFHYYSVCLPALDLFPEAFKQQYIISVCDLDMKNDLKTSKVINWCSVVKNLYPISTTGNWAQPVHVFIVSVYKCPSASSNRGSECATTLSSHVFNGECLYSMRNV